MHWLVGRGLQLMHMCGKMLISKVLLFQRTSTILQMLVFHHAKNFSFHTMGSNITWLNGVVLVSGNYHIFNLSHSIHICINNCRPTTKEELFNLRHASAWNVIECIFGVLKWHFRILLIAPEYNLEVQARWCDPESSEWATKQTNPRIIVCRFRKESWWKPLSVS